MPRVPSFLRDYQGDVYARWKASSARRVLVVMPTAAGKTHVGVAGILDVVRAGGRVLACAHRRELIEQLVARLVGAGVDPAQIGVRMSDARSRRNDAAPIQVVSVPSYRGDLGSFDLIVIDEAHRAAAKSYRKILTDHPTARVMGLTATPLRHDGEPLGELFEELIEVEPAPLIEAGHIARPRFFSAPDVELPDVSKVRRLGGDYDRAELGVRVGRAELWSSIVREWKDRATDLPTVVFAVNVKHAKSIARHFRLAGVRAEVITGKTPTDQRRAIEARVRDAKTQVVVNCEVLCEGWDMPGVRCVVLARPTLSLTIYIQQIGRCARPGKVQPVVLDHAGNARRFGLPEEYAGWSLTTRKEKRAGCGPVMRRCECGALAPVAARVCPECDAELPVYVREEPIENGVPLTEIAKRIGVSLSTLSARICSGRKTLGEAIAMGPVAKRVVMTSELVGISEKIGVDANTFRERLKRHSVEEAIAMGPARMHIRVDIRAGSKRSGIPEKTLYARVQSGYNIEQAIAMGMPEVRDKGLTAAAKVSGVSAATLGRRIRSGKTLEEAIAMGLPRQHDLGISAAARAAGLPIHLVWGRIRKGSSLEEAIAMGLPRRINVSEESRRAGIAIPTTWGRIRKGSSLEEAIAMGPPKKSANVSAS